MRLIARIFLFIFITFLLTPTVVTLIKKSSNTSIFFNMSEEEQAQKEIKDIALFVSYQFSFQTIRTVKLNLIHSENLSKHDKVSGSIFSPPPNLV